MKFKCNLWGRDDDLVEGEFDTIDEIQSWVCGLAPYGFQMASLFINGCHFSVNQYNNTITYGRSICRQSN
jgi:hypothetical protein